VVVVGDFNSDPSDTMVRVGDPLGTAGSGPYLWMTEQAGYLDCVVAAGAPSPTFGFGAGVVDDHTDGFSQRIDFVFARPSVVNALSAVTIGISPGDRDPATGLWPSDHAGVVVTVD
jgi:hypothetical protein